MMGVIPVRDQAGRIVDVVDPDMAAAVAQAEEQAEEQARQRPAPDDEPLAPEDQRPMSEVLQGSRRSGAGRQRQLPQGQILAAQVVIGALLALVLVNVLWRAPVPALPAAASATPTERAATSASGEATDAPGQSARLDRAMVAYSAPEGDVIGAIEPGRAYTVTARLNTTWVQIDTVGGGLVWVHADAIRLAPSLIAAVPDLATPTARPTAAPPPIAIPVYAPPPIVTTPAPCTADRVVAVVSSAAREVWSCASLADALRTLPQGTVVADNPDAAQAYLAEQRRQQTEIAPLLMTPTP